MNDNGECNYCTEQIANIGKVYLPNAEGERKLEQMIKMLKKKVKANNMTALWVFQVVWILHI